MLFNSIAIYSDMDYLFIEKRNTLERKALSLHSVGASSYIFIFQFYPNLSVFLEVCFGYSWSNHVILITSAKLEHLVYKSKKL